MRERWVRIGVASGLVLLGAAATVATAAAQRPVQHVVWRDLTLYQSIEGAVRPVRYTLDAVPARVSFLVDSTRWSNGQRQVFGERSILVVDSLGALLEFVPAPMPARPENESLNRVAIGSLSHPTVGVYFREVENAVVYRALPPALEAGRRWEEPVLWARDTLGVGVREQGVRVTTVLGDTLIDGRRHWLLRDSATVERNETWLEYSYVWGQWYREDRSGP